MNCWIASSGKSTPPRNPAESVRGNDGGEGNEKKEIPSLIPFPSLRGTKQSTCWLQTCSECVDCFVGEVHPSSQPHRKRAGQ